MNNVKSNEEKDLETLRREYRNMEVNRKTFAEESNTILRKQQQTLEKLRDENENLKTDVATLQARTTMKPLNSFEQSQLDKVTLEIERFKHLVVTEKKHISSMEQNITTIREKIWNQRRKMGGTNAATENQRNIEKQVRILENRLDQALVKFNKSLANNRKLREEIDNLRGERIAFEGVYKKLEKGLQDRKRQMAHVIEQSNTAYEQRDKFKLDIVAVEQANKKEQENFDRLMEEMGRTLEAEINAAAERRKTQLPGIVDADEESKIAAEKAAKAAALMKEKEALAKEQEKEVQQFEQLFDRIENATGISDVDELVQAFKNNDEQNFSMFTFVNEQTNDKEILEEQVQALRVENNQPDSNQCSGQMAEHQKLNEIDDKTNLALKQTEKITEKTLDCQAALESIQDGLKMLITRLDCNVENLGNLCINETNMLRYMGIIEEKTNNVLTKYYQCKSRVKNNVGQPETPQIKKAGNSENFTKKIQPTPGPIAVNPPKVVDYSSDENSEDEFAGSRPLSIEELKAKTLSRMNQPRKKPEPVPLVNRRRSSVLARRRGSILATSVI